jgi:hypothetical protein
MPPGPNYMRHRRAQDFASHGMKCSRRLSLADAKRSVIDSRISKFRGLWWNFAPITHFAP